ncbi:hypothetical protein M404DRAFT_1003802 [Pisolithus tinctorius Marx 270]|uniref:Uncharacterized protein n=1 Tax=Pisolithus tinctorius Marx 270 TaxID=870435 RepID=A0A0C3IUK9_PISTI|nr:hypothetical protein M404DRAFT_1003802 [Pisolithus tinctorius Marx 270]
MQHQCALREHWGMRLRLHDCFGLEQMYEYTFLECDREREREDDDDNKEEGGEPLVEYEHECL